MNNRPLLSTSSIADDKVKSAQGDDLGSIKDIMINTQTGVIEYAVLSFGGFLGLGDKYFAVPWSSISVNRDDHSLTLNVDKEKLKDAPGFDKGNWPDMADPIFKEKIYSHYGVTYQ